MIHDQLGLRERGISCTCIPRIRKHQVTSEIFRGILNSECCMTILYHAIENTVAITQTLQHTFMSDM